jgi:hypothetical protein
MLTGPIPATEKVLDRAGMSISAIDAVEVNEAFASVPLAWQAEFAIDPERLNPRGGAIALGHPLGASGARLMTTLINHLEQTGGRFGLQTMCEAAPLDRVAALCDHVAADHLGDPCADARRERSRDGRRVGSRLGHRSSVHRARCAHSHHRSSDL